MAKFWCCEKLLDVHFKDFLAFVGEKEKAKSGGCTTNFVVWIKEEMAKDKKLLRSDGTQTKAAELYKKYASHEDAYERMLSQYQLQQKTLRR